VSAALQLDRSCANRNRNGDCYDCHSADWEATIRRHAPNTTTDLLAAAREVAGAKPGAHWRDKLRVFRQDAIAEIGWTAAKKIEAEMLISEPWNWDDLAEKRDDGGPEQWTG
jgi:hypothetical protein